MAQQSVLITGGSGLIGRHLSSLLIEKVYRVSHLSRKPGIGGSINQFAWDPAKKIIDTNALEGVDYIVHLSGANIGQGRWTEERKKEIIESRAGSADLLFSEITRSGNRIKAFISASAAGFYGTITSEKIFSEADPPASDFLGSACREWEEAADQFEKSGIRTVKVRTGVVLEKTDGALSRFLAAARFGLFPVIGTGRQYMPWIHIADLCKIYLMAITDSTINGPLNAVSPVHLTHREFMKILAGVLDKPFIHPPVPGFAIKLVMGESAIVALEGSRISSKKLTDYGFTFSFSDPVKALSHVLK